MTEQMKFVGMLNLSSINRVKDFAKFSNNYDGEVELHSGRYIIDGKSILGIFSIDVSRPIEMFVSETELESYETFIEQCKLSKMID